MIGHGALIQQPDFAAKIMNLIAAFASVEIDFGVLFADILGIDAPLGTEIYNELTARVHPIAFGQLDGRHIPARVEVFAGEISTAAETSTPAQ